MISIKKIAQLAGCSVSTVSKALNGYSSVNQETREHILKVAKDHGYVPNAMAQSLVRKRSNLIGVVYDVEFGLQNTFFIKILESFRKQALIYNYDILLLSHLSNDHPDYVRHARSHRVDGVIVISEGSYPSSIHELRESGLPVVTFDPYTLVPNSVTTDNYQAIKKSCKYLYDLGHRKIAFIQGDYYTQVGKARLDGYCDFMNEHQLDLIRLEGISNTSYTFEEGYKTMQSLFEKFGLPDAVCAASDLMAIGAMSYLQTNGIEVPNEVSVIGFDDLAFCDIVSPKLTTIHQDYDELGKQAMERLIEVMNDPQKKLPPVLVSASLVVRQSCRKRAH